MKLAALFSAIALLIPAAACAQEKKPLSPPAKATGTVGNANITIDYSAPSMRGRKIFGGLVPYGKEWRTGANAATKLTTTGNIKIGDLSVPAGTYTVYTIPEEGSWTLIVNKQTGQWGTEYNSAQDLGRTKMTVTKISSPVETFHISLDGGKLTMEWADTEASVPITAE